MIAASWFGSVKPVGQDKQEGGCAVRVGSISDRSWLWRAGLELAKDWVPNPRDSWDSIPFFKNRLLSFEPDDEPLESFMPGKLLRLGGSGLSSTWLSQYFKTAGSYLQKPSYSERVPPILSEDCRDLAWMIAYLKGAKEEVFADITQALRAVVPAFRQVRHRPVPVVRLEKKEATINKQSVSYNDPQKVMGQELRFDMASGSDLPASAISEGTLVTLAIFTAIIHDDNPKQGSHSEDDRGAKTILLDNIESGLHPSAQRDLIRQLRRLLETRPELQIIFSSHSPYIIDEMQSEEVWLLAPDKEGIAHCAKLIDHPDAKRALGVLTTGEFWSAEGESWVLDPSKRADGTAAAVER